MSVVTRAELQARVDATLGNLWLAARTSPVLKQWLEEYGKAERALGEFDGVAKQPRENMMQRVASEIAVEHLLGEVARLRRALARVAALAYECDCNAEGCEVEEAWREVDALLYPEGDEEGSYCRLSEGCVLIRGHVGPHTTQFRPPSTPALLEAPDA